MKQFKCPFTEEIIDFSPLPMVPKKEWKVKYHFNIGFRKLSLMKFFFYFTPGQLVHTGTMGSRLYLVVKEKTTIPANLLDYFLRHPEDIPEELKGNPSEIFYTFFWGTIYEDQYGICWVRCLYFDHGSDAWKGGAHSFDLEYKEHDEFWGYYCPALIAA